MNDIAVKDSEIKHMAEVFSADKMRTKRGIQEFANKINNMPEALGEDPFPLFHTFGGGVYTREIHLPKGYILVGKLHKHECMVYMLKGKVLVADENGVRMVEGPCQFVSQPGIKRVGLVIEDVVWIDIHQTKTDSIEEAEAEIFQEDYSEFELMCEDLGYSVEEVRRISENDADMISDENEGIYIAESEIEGNGVFAAKAYVPRETIGLSRVNFNRTELGRFANHAFQPNAKCDIKNNSIYFVAIKPIEKDEEITVDYREVRQKALELDKMIENSVDTGWLSCQA